MFSLSEMYFWFCADGPQVGGSLTIYYESVIGKKYLKECKEANHGDKIMKCYLEKCGTACGECADRVPKAMLVGFRCKNFKIIM